LNSYTEFRRREQDFLKQTFTESLWLLETSNALRKLSSQRSPLNKVD